MKIQNVGTHTHGTSYLSMAGKGGFANLDCRILGAHAPESGVAESGRDFRDGSARPRRLLEPICFEIRLRVYLYMGLLRV